MKKVQWNSIEKKNALEAVIMNANKIIPENLVAVCLLWEIHLPYKPEEHPINVGCLEFCDWSPFWFKEVNFSKLADSNQIFRNDFVWINYIIISGKFQFKLLSVIFLLLMNSHNNHLLYGTIICIAEISVWIFIYKI